MRQFQVRRVVTGHDDVGRSVVLHDGLSPSVRSPRPGHHNTLIWCTDKMPVPLPIGLEIEDMGTRPLRTYPPRNGARFMVTEYPPGNVPRMHRTDTIDFITVISGRILMYLDDNAMVELKAGEVMVQRGTVHAWVNPGPEYCRMSFVLLDAEPLALDHTVPRDDV